MPNFSRPTPSGAAQETWMNPPPPRRRAAGNKALAAAAFIAAALGLHAANAADQAKTSEDKPYTVKDGKVDKNTYNGWRRYTESCLRCHGPDGAGSSYGPDLTESLKQLSKEQFNEVVVNGRQNVNTANTNVMPPFGTAEDVMLYLDDIYAYLKARSDGVLGRGRPERFDR
jgi:methanol metabolism-related c-type cytochrome